MARTLEDLLRDQNTLLERSSDLPEGDELNYRVRVINQSIRTWSLKAKWRQLKKDLNTSASTNNPSVSLGRNFVSLLAPAQVMMSSTEYEEYEEIQPELRFSKDVSDKYLYITGNSSTDYVANFNNLASGASLSIPYFISPSGMATLTDYCEVSDPEFVLYDSTATIMGPNSPRFTEYSLKARDSLKDMLKSEAYLTPGGVNQVRRGRKTMWRLGTSRGV